MNGSNIIRLLAKGRALCRLLGLIAVLAMVPGCLTGPREYLRNGFKVGPNYRPVKAAVGEDWIDFKNPQLSTESNADFRWWAAFHDPLLDQLIENASQQNLTVRQAGFRIMEARALDAVARGQMLPQSQTATGSYTRNLLSNQVGFAGGGAVPGIAREYSLWNLGTQFQWELDFWGRFRRGIEAADANLDASIEEYDDVLVLLLADVATAYVDVRTLEQRIRYARQNVSSQAGSLKLAEDKESLGAASELDISQAVTNVAQTEATIPQFEADLRVAENRLCTLLGMPPQDIKALLAGDRAVHPIPATAPEVVVGIPADLLRRRPDIRRQERLVARQSALIGVAEADLYPAFSINGQISFQADKFQNLFNSTATAGNIGPSFNWNILNYGRLRNLVAAEEARFMQQVTLYQQTVLDANREAEDAIVRFLRAYEQVGTLRTSANAASRSSTLVNELYQAGRTDFGRVFVAESAQVQQQDALAVAEGNFARAFVEINRALGGGWQIRQQPAQSIAPLTVVEPRLEPLPEPELDGPAESSELPIPEPIETEIEKSNDP